MASSSGAVGLVPFEQPRTAVALLPPARPASRNLDGATSQWQLALDAAHQALSAASGSLPGPELQRRRRALARERRETETLLVRLARTTGMRDVPWLSPLPVDRNMLGLPPATRACLFDLDGVLTDSAALHARAWGEVFDEFLRRMSERVSWHYVPFDRDADYRAYIEGRPRLEGIHTFLDSRGIRIPEGRFNDSAQAETAFGLARRKGDVLARGLHEQRVRALRGARRYLEAAGHAGLQRSAVSASTSMSSMLELAGLTTLLEDWVGGDVMQEENLRARPAPDLLLAACRRLGVGAAEAVTFTSSSAGVAAGRAAGLTVVGVSGGADPDSLATADSERVVGSLLDLLDVRLHGELRKTSGAADLPHA